ncbi:MAG: beta-ketoacyl-[acyl-carrier-protein] synthase family protein [Phycisphaerales bacterium]|nr:beta-ketoacyl-[acyl-carrier-protein] synthase family protein [Phycisphaerales bacterium]
MPEEVVITGLGIQSPVGCSVDAFWSSLCAGRSGAKSVTSFDTAELPRHVACTIEEPMGGTVHGGRASQLAVSAARQAMADAGLEPRLTADARTDVIMGTTMGETEFIENRLFAGADEWLNDAHVHEIMNGRPGCIARAVQADVGSGGRATDVYGACAAGNMAIAVACQALRSGHCDIALAGGSDGFSRLAFIGFMRLRLTAADVCRPFDKDRDGLFVGEGATVFVLERLSSARARGVRIRAKVAGWAMTSESYHPTRPDPEGDGLRRAIRGAMTTAGMTAADIDYVNAHGTGTPQNDMIEAKVMNECLRPGTPFSSTKALTGHTMGAAGALEAAVCVLTLEHQKIIPTWHLREVLSPCEMDAVKDGVRDARVRAALNNSAGFGGYNSSVIVTAA